PARRVGDLRAARARTRRGADGDAGRMMTGMADTVGVDASAPAAGGAPQEDPLVIAGRAMRSRLLLGTGGFPSLELLSQAIAAAGSELVTGALRRIDPE